MLFVFHCTGSSIANDHYIATDDRCNNIDLRPSWRVVFGKFIVTSPNSWSHHKLRYHLNFFPEYLSFFFSITVFLLSFCKYIFQELSSMRKFFFGDFLEPHFPRLNIGFGRRFRSPPISFHLSLRNWHQPWREENDINSPFCSIQAFFSVNAWNIFPLVKKFNKWKRCSWILNVFLFDNHAEQPNHWRTFFFISYLHTKEKLQKL